MLEQVDSVLMDMDADLKGPFSSPIEGDVDIEEEAHTCTVLE